MEASFTQLRDGTFASLVLLYLILVAQFRSFLDPVLILLAVPTGIIGVLADSASHGDDPQRDVAHGTDHDGRHRGLQQHLDRGIRSSPGRSRDGSARRDHLVVPHPPAPILMTSLATIIGLFPLALKLGTGSEQYAPLARVIIGGLITSVSLTIFIVPAAYLAGVSASHRGACGQSGEDAR